MGSIAVQTAIGELGKKATTELSYAYKALASHGKFQYGLNATGLFLLNIGEQDDGIDYVRSFTLASSDYGVDNIKKLRYIYLGADADLPFTISVMGDDKVWHNYIPVLYKTGLQEIRVPISSIDYGRYWRVKISSLSRFRIDRINSLIVIRSLGHRG